MIGLDAQARRRVYAYGAPVDMRKGFDGLYALVFEFLGRNPLSGDLFLFVSRNRIRAKVLVWDGTGLCVSGAGTDPDSDNDSAVALTTVAVNLAWLDLEGWIAHDPVSGPGRAPEGILGPVGGLGGHMRRFSGR